MPYQSSADQNDINAYMDYFYVKYSPPQILYTSNSAYGLR